MKKMIQALCLCLLLSAPGLAQAALVTYDFSGVLTTVSGVSGPVVGQSFTGSLSYDAGTLLGSAPGASFGEVQMYSSPLTWQITAGGQQYTSFAQPKYGVSTGGTFSANTSLGVLIGSAGSLSSGPWNVPGSGYPATYAESVRNLFAFVGISGSQISPWFESVYSLSEMTLGGPVDLSVTVKGDITSFSERPQPTPLPAAVWLLGSGLVGLAGLRKKFMKA